MSHNQEKLYIEHVPMVKRHDHSDFTETEIDVHYTPSFQI